MANFTSFRTKWFLWFAAHAAVFLYVTTTVAPVFPQEQARFPITTVLVGMSMSSLAAGFLLFRDPAKMHAQLLKRRPASTVQQTANNTGRLAFAFLITPLAYGTVDAVVTGQNHAFLFLAVALLGAALYWKRLGSVLRSLADLPEKKRPGPTDQGRA
ncbi:MAG: hypothetical protein M3198_15000 [Actinomycetota bacterium]|nr:hypothetical protein [Actinomycetota bacterium]